MIQPLASFFSLQKADYALELAMYVLIVLGLGVTALFAEYTPSSKGGTFIIVAWGILLWRRFMTFESLKKWPFSLISWIQQWEEKKIKTLCSQSSTPPVAENPNLH